MILLLAKVAINFLVGNGNVLHWQGPISRKRLSLCWMRPWLDPTLEQRLLEWLCKHLKHHTILMIFHRPTVLLKMDRVITLHQGKVVLDTPAYGLTESQIWPV